MADAARTRLGLAGGGSAPTAGLTTLEMAEAVSGFHFPEDLWARIIYDLVITARREAQPIEKYVAALVPIYFGRVGAFIIENRRQTTDEAEERVERQAREFELVKPYLIERWNSEGSTDVVTPPVPAGAGG